MTCSGIYHVKFVPEHNAHCLKAEKLRSLLRNQHFLSKVRNSLVPNEVTLFQIFKFSQIF